MTIPMIQVSTKKVSQEFVKDTVSASQKDTDKSALLTGSNTENAPESELRERRQTAVPREVKNNVESKQTNSTQNQIVTPQPDGKFDKHQFLNLVTVLLMMAILVLCTRKVYLHLNRIALTPLDID